MANKETKIERIQARGYSLRKRGTRQWIAWKGNEVHIGSIFKIHKLIFYW